MNFRTAAFSASLFAAAAVLFGSPATAQQANTAGQGTVTTEATPLERVRKPSLLVFQFKGAGVSEAIVRATMDFTAGSFARTDRFDLMTMDDVGTLLDLEATKSSMGCDDESCMAELAGAVGADFIVAGKITKLGEIYAINVSILDPSKAKVVGLETVKASALENIPAVMDRAALRLTYRAFGEAIPDELKPKKRRRRRRPTAAADEEPNVVGSVIMYSGAAIGGIAAAAAVLAFGIATASIATLLVPSAPGLGKLFARYGTTIGGGTAIALLPLVALSLGAAGVGWMIE